MQKRLIEWDLPLADISEVSAREKNIRKLHPSTMHIWWARKPLAASRGIAFATLLNDPGRDNPAERINLINLIKKVVKWEAGKEGESTLIKDARNKVLQQFGTQPKMLDPFSGG